MKPKTTEKRITLEELDAMGLTPKQVEHVKSCFPTCRYEMAHYLKQGAPVIIKRQQETKDSHSFAICVAERPSFCIDSCSTPIIAERQAARLGLSVAGKAI